MTVKQRAKTEAGTVTYELSGGKIDERGTVRDSFSIMCTLGKESAFFYDITSEESRAFEIFKLFVSNTVTPCGAFDIMDELL